MRLFILGANGRTGSELIDLALARGHEVTAFVRSPEKILRQDARLRVVAGDPHDPEAMARAMKGHDAVFSALGPRPSEAFRGTTLLHDCAASAVSAMTASGVHRILFVSSAMLFPRIPLILRLFPVLFRHHVEDLRRSEAVLKESALDWTVARPPRLVRAKGEAYRNLEDGFMSGPLQMSYRAVALFLLESAEKGLHSRKVVGLAGPARAKRQALHALERSA
jgi:putative NADH-flavin reductase